MDVRLLRPRGPRTPEYVHRAGATAHVVRWTIDPARRSPLVVTANRERVAVGAERNAVAEQVTRVWIAGLDVRLLRPGVARECEDVHGSRRRRRVVRLVPIDARRSAVLADRSNRQGAPIVAECHRHTELIAIAEAVGGGARFARVGGLDIRTLGPRRPTASEDVRGACLRDRVVVLIAVDTGRFARFAVGRDGQRVAVGAQRDDVPELRAHLGIRRLDVGLLRPSFALPHEDIHRAGAVHRVVVLVAVEPLRAATLVRCSDRHGVPVAADGHAPSSMTVEHAAAPEMVLDLWIRRLEVGDLLQLSRC